MKKFITISMLLCMMLTLFAGCGKAAAPVETTPAEVLPGSTLEVLETVWGKYAEEEKFAVIGGNIEANVMGAPGAYDLTYAENMTFNLLVPTDRIADVAEAASMIHMMNANSFTCGAFKMAEGVAAADFAAAMEASIKGNQWMCGFPDKMLIQTIGDSYVIAAFGVEDLMTAYAAHMAEAYPNAQILVDAPVI